MNWITINNFSDIDQIKEDSKYNPQFIFKHSTRCSISKMVMNRFESIYNSSKNWKITFLRKYWINSI